MLESESGARLICGGLFASVVASALTVTVGSPAAMAFTLTVSRVYHGAALGTVTSTWKAAISPVANGPTVVVERALSQLCAPKPRLNDSG